jgi:hypothetical protein
VEQMMSVTAQRGIGHSADTLLIEITVDPVYFPAVMADYTKRTLRVRQRLLLDYMESHRHASSSGR